MQVKNLKKYFTKPKLIKAVDEVSFDIVKGEIVGILGPNGAGKTTTIQMLLGVLTPTSGEIVYFGKDFFINQEEVKKEINFTSGYSRLPGKLTVGEALDVYGRIYEIKNRKLKIEKLLKAFKVWELKDKLNMQLSAGQKTRVMLAKAFLNWPRIILLDEPTASLDPEIASEVRQFLLYQQKEYQVTILLTSHNMKEVEELCHRVIFLNEGRVLACDTPEKLISQTSRAQLRLKVMENNYEGEEYLKRNKLSFKYKKGKLVIDLTEKEIPKVLHYFSQNKIYFSDIDILRPDLEDFFLQTIRKNEHQ